MIISSCTTTYNTYHYSDPNYLNADEFTQNNNLIEKNNNEIKEVQDSIKEEVTTGDINNYYGDYYESEDPYNSYYSSRIRRFHRPMFGYSYYGGLYTNNYWYNRYDPFYY